MLAIGGKEQQDAIFGKILDGGLVQDMSQYPVKAFGNTERNSATIRTLLYTRRLLVFRGWGQDSTWGASRDIGARHTLVSAMRAACAHEFPGDAVRAVEVEQWVRREIAAVTQTTNLVDWNNRTGRTKAQVLAALEQALHRLGCEPPLLDRGGRRNKNSPYNPPERAQSKTSDVGAALRIFRAVTSELPPGDVPRKILDAIEMIFEALAECKAKS